MPGQPGPLKRRALAAVALLAPALLLLPASLHGQAGDVDGARPDAGDAPRQVEAVRLDDGERIRLDGRLEEQAWARAVPASGFLQQDPDEGAPATEDTEVRILFDEDALYIGVRAWDSDPDGILAFQRRRDASLRTDDRFRLILDTFLDGRTGYLFEINPAGLMSDGLLEGGGSLSRAWDGIWEVRTRRDDRGWTAEIRIPFRTLNFNPSLEAWGINFQRTIRRKNEETLWSGHRRTEGLMRPVHAGRLEGLAGLSQGLGLEATPFATGSWRRDVAAGEDDEFPGDLGIDLEYSVTPSLRAAVSVNTDFAQVEVDDRRVNLTRFPLFFPERRDFFLEGSGVFNFAPRNGVTPFFSRRIGLRDGEEIPIRVGARLAGQAGAQELGFLQVRTGSRDGLPAEDFTAARVVRNVFEESSVGVIFTRRASGGPVPGGETSAESSTPPDRYTAGLDFNYFTSRFMGDRNLRFQTFFLWHNDPVAEPGPGEETSALDRSARGLRLSYPNDPFSARVSYRELGEAYDPAVGFTSRNGFRRLQPTVEFTPRPGWSSVRRLVFRVRYERLMDMDGRRMTELRQLRLPRVEFEDGSRVTVDLARRFERLQSPFTIHPGITVPLGVYRMGQWEISGRTAPQHRFSASASVTGGEFWSGNRTTLEAGVSARPFPGIALSLEGQRNDVRLEEGDFTTHVGRVLAEWHPSSWVSLTTNLQFDDVSDVLGLNSRFRWIVRPGSEIWVVYTHNWQSLDADGGRSGLATLSRDATTKITYTHRF